MGLYDVITVDKPNSMKSNVSIYLKRNKKERDDILKKKGGSKGGKERRKEGSYV